MHRLGAPAVELLKFQSFGWISILALRLYQVSLSLASPLDLSPGPTCILAHLLATIAAHAHALARPRILRPRRTSSGSTRTSRTAGASC